MKTEKSVAGSKRKEKQTRTVRSSSKDLQELERGREIFFGLSLGSLKDPPMSMRIPGRPALHLRDAPDAEQVLDAAEGVDRHAGQADPHSCLICPASGCWSWQCIMCLLH